VILNLWLTSKTYNLTKNGNFLNIRIWYYSVLILDTRQENDTWFTLTHYWNDHNYNYRSIVNLEYNKIDITSSKTCFALPWLGTTCRTISHSFILNIYIAPLQENYSEALPTPARSNKAVLR